MRLRQQEMTDKIFKKSTDNSKEKSLYDVKDGQSVVVHRVVGEPSDCQRLNEMGFCERARVEKVTESGSVICKVCSTRVILSEGLARSILVRPCDKKLSELSIGERAIITDFIEENDACARLEEMGMTAGERIEVIRYAPLGAPIEVKVRGYLLSLRKEEADLIKVSVC